MIHNHQTWTFPAHKMMPPSELLRWWYPGKGKWRCPPGTVKVMKRQHRKRSRRWLKEQTVKEVDSYYRDD